MQFRCLENGLVSNVNRAGLIDQQIRKIQDNARFVVRLRSLHEDVKEPIEREYQAIFVSFCVFHISMLYD